MLDLETNELSDDELERLALAADPDADLPDDAVSIWQVVGGCGASTLPGWYLPQAGPPQVQPGWRRWIGVLIVVALLAIPAAGLCVTYGQLSLA